MYRRKTRPNIPQQQSAAQTAPLPAPSARWSALAKAVHIGINSRDLRKEFARSGRDPYVPGEGRRPCRVARDEGLGGLPRIPEEAL